MIPRIGQQKFRVFALLAGLVLLALLIEQAGPAAIAAEVWAFGAGFLLLILITAIRHVFRTIAWQHSIEPEMRRVRFRDLFAIRLVGEAVTDLTFFGPLLGETVKGFNLSERIAPEQSASSIVIENLAYAFATGLLLVGGLALLVADFAMPPSLVKPGLGILAGLLLAAVGVAWIIKKRYKVTRKLVGLVKKLKFDWGSYFQSRQVQLDRFEDNIHDFCRRHRFEAVFIFLLECLAILAGVVEAYVILGLTVHRSSFVAALVIEALNRAVTLFFAFVPLRIGVDEGGAALVVKAVGYTASEGVSLAIIRKVRTLFWVALGLLLAARYSVNLKTPTAGSASPVAASKQ